MKVIVSAGGTGGHIYPALSIIEKLKEKDKKLEVLYIGTTDRMEKDIVPQHNINYVGIKIKGFNRKNIFKNILVLIYFVNALFKTKKIMKEFKPDVVIGVGGYVTAPVIYMAHRLGIKTLIHEQNSEFGMTNKFLSRFVDVIASSFPNMKIKNKEVIYTGNPTGDSSMDVNFNKEELGLSKNKKLVMIVMGSLGSDVTSEKMLKILPHFKNQKYEVVYVTGKDYYYKFKDLDVNKNIFIFPYIEDMRKTFKSVDIMVSRAGASTMSEIIAYGVPTILIPSPYVTNNHQYKNAMDLVNKNAAILIEEKDLNWGILVKTINDLINDEAKLKEIKRNLSSLYIPNSADKICDLILELKKGR